MNRLKMYDYNNIIMQWCKGIENKDRILDFLYKVDDILIPRLSARVDMSNYASKLAANAHSVFLLDDKKDIASCSVYCNTEIGFITSIAVKEPYIGKGIGTLMLQEVVKHCKEQGCTQIRLQVYNENIRALNMYHRNKFYAIQEFDDSKMLRLDI